MTIGEKGPNLACFPIVHRGAAAEVGARTACERQTKDEVSVPADARTGTAETAANAGVERRGFIFDAVGSR